MIIHTLKFIFHKNNMKNMKKYLTIIIILFAQFSWAQPCNLPPAINNPCLAPILCNNTQLDQYCGRTDTIYPIMSPIPFCGAPNNNEFLAFIAGSEYLSFQINVDLASCTGTPDGSGLQAEIYAATSCDTGSTYTSVSNCFSSNYAPTGILTCLNLDIGNKYYIMIDGWSGDVCDYSIDLISGSIQPQTAGCDTCSNVLLAGTIGKNQLIFYGNQADSLKNIVLPAGGSGDIEYQWFYWTMTQPTPESLPLSNSSGFSPGGLFETTWFMRGARRTGCSDYLFSNSIKIDVLDPEKCYLITNDYQQKRLGIVSNSTANGADAKVFSPNNTAISQVWQFEGFDNNFVGFKSFPSQKFLQVEGGTVQAGATIEQYDYTGSFNQHWKIESSSTDSYIFKNRMSKKRMSVSLTNNSVIQNSPVVPMSSQRWRLQVLNTCPTIPVNATDMTERSTLPGKYEEAPLDMTVFPNPANKLLFVNLENLPDEVSSASIYNMLGVCVQTISPVTKQSSTLSVNLENLPEGLYSICIETGGEPFCQKFIKIQ